MKAVQTINILMLLSAWIELVSGLGFGDWSLKFSKNKPKKLYNKFYDPKWAFYVMHQKRHHKPDMNIEDFFRDVEGNMFEDIMHNHVGLPHLLPAPEKNSSNNDLVENDDDQIVSESSHSTGFHKFHFANIKKYSKNRNTMSFQNFEKFRLKKQPLVRPTTKKPLQRPTKPNMLRPAVHKSQHHSSIASRQQSLVSSVSDSERQELPLNSKAQLLRPIRGRFVNASAVALLSFLYLLNLTQDVMQTVASGRRRKKRRRRRNLFQT